MKLGRVILIGPNFDPLCVKVDQQGEEHHVSLRHQAPSTHRCGVLVVLCWHQQELIVLICTVSNTWGQKLTSNNNLCVEVFFFLFFCFYLRKRDTDAKPTCNRLQSHLHSSWELLLWQCAVLHSYDQKYRARTLQYSVTSPVTGSVTCQSQLCNVLWSAQAKGYVSCA